MILSVAKRIFAPVAIVFLAYFAWDARESLLATVENSEPVRLLVAVVTWSMMYLVAPLLSAVVFRARGHKLPYRKAADIHIGNLPARYVPGGIWHTVGRIAGFKRAGIGAADIAVFVFLENALAVGVAFAIGGGIVAAYHEHDTWRRIALAAAAGGTLVLLAAPFFLARRSARAGIALRDYLAATAVVALSWCVGAAAFVIFLAAFPALELRTAPLETAGAYLFAWGAGFVSVFAPQGIGVFEVVAADLLRGAASLEGTAALLAGFRLVILAADALMYALLRGLTALCRPASRVGH